MARHWRDPQVSYLMILIPVSLGMGLVGLGAFFWALTHHQYDDPKGDALRVLSAEDRPATLGNRDHAATGKKGETEGRDRAPERR